MYAHASMATVIAALGGSLLRPEVEQRHRWLEDLIEIIRDRVAMDDRIGLVVGGGAAAREGIALARPIIDSENRLDRIGIAATRLNAAIVRESLADAGIPVSGTIPHSVNEAVSLLEERQVVVMGGTRPGHTTDAVAIRLAIAVGAERCVIATNVAKVHESDPRTDPNAVAHDRLTHSQLQAIVGPAEHSRAGPSQVVDPMGVKAAASAGMPLSILDGRDSEAVRSAIEGGDFGGTVIE